MINKTLVIVASGPSLDDHQVSLLNDSKVDIMVINDNYKLFPNAKFLFAADMRWWYEHYRYVPDSISAYTLKGNPEHLGKRLPGASNRLIGIDFTHEFGLYDDKVHHGGNSGYMGLQLGRLFGYSKLILVGFDCQHTNGKRHWFGDHDKTKFTKNPDDVERWVESFGKLSKLLYNIEIVNCSKETALTCFKRQDLLDTLNESSI